MKISTSGKHMDIGESLNVHIEKTLKDLVDRQLGDVLEAQVVLSKESQQFITDICVHVSRHFVVRTRADDTDAYQSYNQALEKMETRISRYKARLRKQKRGREDDFSLAQHYVVNSQDEDKGEDNPVVIAEMNHEIPKVTAGQAVMLMDLSDLPVMMFENTNSGQLNVVYRRPDGNVGWIDPSMMEKK